MAYCTNADVQAEFKDIAFTGALLTTTKVDEWIAQADQEIDAYLVKRYEVPITGAAALIVVKQLSIWLVAGRIANILKVKTNTQKFDQEGQNVNLRKIAMTMLADIRDKKLDLSGATNASSDLGFSSYVGANDVEPEFEAESEQW